MGFTKIPRACGLINYLFTVSPALQPVALLRTLMLCLIKQPRRPQLQGRGKKKNRHVLSDMN